MCKTVEENAVDSIDAYLSNKPAEIKPKNNLQPLETIHQELTKILSPIKTENTNANSNGDVSTSNPPPQHEPGPVNGTTTTDVVMEEALPNTDGQHKSNDESQGGSVIVLE